MRYFMDTEFIDDGHCIDLISIGIVCEDGRELYLQSAECDLFRASPWVKEHVIPHLVVCPHVYPEYRKDIYTNRVLHGGQEGQCTFTRGENVIGAHGDCPWRTHLQMKYEVAHFFQPDGEHTPFELWGWCAGYDFVALCQLFGTMMDIPAGWPHYIRDFQYVLDEYEVADEDLPAQEAIAHNALEDARHLKRLWGYILRNDCWQ